MRNGEVYSAVYGIIENEKGEILFQRRSNTGFKDGFFQLPGGHIEGDEDFTTAIKRELQEELNITSEDNNIELLHISHRISKGERVYFDTYLHIKKYMGEIQNNEPNKCSELKFIDIDTCNRAEMSGHDIDVIQLIKKGIQFSEVII